MKLKKGDKAKLISLEGPVWDNLTDGATYVITSATDQHVRVIDDNGQETTPLCSWRFKYVKTRKKKGDQ